MTRKKRGVEARVRGALDAWFGTLARYAGLAVLLYAVFVDRLRNPALLPLIPGLMFLKNVVGGGKDE